MVRLLRTIDVVPSTGSGHDAATPEAPRAIPRRIQPRAAVRVSVGPALPIPSPPQPKMETLRKRQMLAELCRLIGTQVGAGHLARSLAADPSISPRMRQTLERLLCGDSEKQIAGGLHLSINTVHSYVKTLYRHFKVSSRGELLAHFVRRSHEMFTPTDPREVRP